MPQYCVLMLGHRESNGTNCSRHMKRMTGRALVALSAVCVCALLCLSSISGIYEIRVLKVVTTYYQTTVYDYDYDNRNATTGTLTVDDDLRQSFNVSDEQLPVLPITVSVVQALEQLQQQQIDSSLSDDTATIKNTNNNIDNTGGTSEATTGNAALSEISSATSEPSSQQQQRYDMIKYDTTSYYNMTRPTNLRLVIIGDSISRYQYISLVHFLQTGTWITDATKLIPDINDLPTTGLSTNTPLHCKNPGIKAREQFYSLSHSFLQPNELLCDCRGYSENRYYVDTERNNYVTYITKFGKNSTSGRYSANQIRGSMDSGTGKKGERKKHTSDQWKYEYWNETIHYHIAQLKPKPQFLLFNAGLHAHDLNFKYIRQSIIEVTKRHNIIPIYKTTTYPNNISITLNDFPLASHDLLLCGQQSNDSSTDFQYCIDLSWTSQLFGDDHYYDYYHFKPYWNYYMNLQTLLYIQQFQPKKNVENRLISSRNDKTANILPAIFRPEDVKRIINRRLNIKI